MKIKSFGCSFIYGTDLQDEPNIEIVQDLRGEYSHLTWPALLSKKLGHDYECFARPGSGNLQIAERILNECNSKDSNFFIINWTWIDRFDYNERPDDVWQPWGTLHPMQKDLIHETY